ncbi:hypothetical protein J3R30DRAFT_3403276 [Lentinula aciculospora]|uniref:Uncharacterized protein n=1 Tax=Lentinula aciculospora TaxID=153920 RepID=A0A9W9AEK3_9AGAR|nr:hypothetical protein J3R30DRAFT_3403276 [Lentinula aciculospora]
MADPCIPDAWHKRVQLLDGYLDKLPNALPLVRGDEDTAYPGFINWGMPEDWWATGKSVEKVIHDELTNILAPAPVLLKAIKAAKGVYDYMFWRVTGESAADFKDTNSTHAISDSVPQSALYDTPRRHIIRAELLPRIHVDVSTGVPHSTSTTSQDVSFDRLSSTMGTVGPMDTSTQLTGSGSLLHRSFDADLSYGEGLD